MKIIVLNTVLITGCFLFAGCNDLIDSIRSFIPGAYAAEWKNEFSESRDTIWIESLTKEGSETYLITRKSYFNYVNKRKEYKPEYKLVRWSGSYDEKEKTISVHNTGRVLSFDPARSEMKMGTITYKKL